MPFQIAIDGPVAAGKGTVARLVAARLHFLYVDTGAMYRATAWLATQKGIGWEHEMELVHLLAEHDLQLRSPSPQEQDGRLITVLIDGQDVSWMIRTEEVGKGASIVSQHPQVRQALVQKQQAIASQQDVVMEGRDITFRVLPEAQLKIYMDASPEVRAKRRHQDLLIRGMDVQYESVFQELVERDRRDRERAVDPLHPVDDAWRLDTTPYTIPQVVDIIVAKVEELRKTSQ